jgi:hypothetical protein
MQLGKYNLGSYNVADSFEHSQLSNDTESAETRNLLYLGYPKNPTIAMKAETPLNNLQGVLYVAMVSLQSRQIFL